MAKTLENHNKYHKYPSRVEIISYLCFRFDVIMFFCFIFDVDLVVGHREGYPVSFFSYCDVDGNATERAGTTTISENPI